MKKLQPILFGFLLLGAACMAGFGLLRPDGTLVRQAEESVCEELEELRTPARYLYGLEVGEMEICTDYVQRNQFLSEILQDYRISLQTIDQLARTTKDVFDARYMRVGQKYCVLLDTTDPEMPARHFVYEDGKYEYIVYTFLEDTVVANRARKPIELRHREASGIINSSLYLTLQENKIDPALAIRMSEIYAWTIDFYRLQKGDKFKIYYQEEYVDGEYAGLGAIDAVLFNHMERDIYGFYFEPDTLRYGDYFDETGKSLRKAFLTAPVKFSRISSRYTGRRFHPVQKRYKAHLGTDYAAPRGTPIYATADGVVTEAQFKRYNGNYVKVRHNGTYTTQYLHMSKIARGMRPGKYVRQGEVIGYVGSTGLATGPHVCYRFWKNGKQVDPYKQKLPEAEPIADSLRPAYESLMEVARKKLDAIPYPLSPADSIRKDELAMAVQR